MRFRLIFLLFITITLHAMQVNVVPLDAVQWTSDSATPTTAGIARRGQVYFLVDFSVEEGRKMYGNLRDTVDEPALAKKYDQVNFILAPGGSIDPQREDKEKEYWCKGNPQNAGIVHAFGGDALAVAVIVNASGRVVSITRITGKTDEKAIQEACKGAAPIDAAALPASCKIPLQWLQLGDTGRALKDSRKAGADTALFIKFINDRVNSLIQEDATVVADKSGSPSQRMIALFRLQGLISEFPGAPASKEAQAVIKGIKDDKAVQNEQSAFAMLSEYLNAMRKVTGKKATPVQVEWLSGINRKFSGTYAAEIATMIKKCSKIE